jgi:transposase InsO family protein
MFAILRALGMFVAGLFKSRTRLEAENLFLRHQLNIALRRAPPRLRLRGSDRALLTLMTMLWPRLLGAAQLVQPETILRWHRDASVICRASHSAVFTSRVRAMGIRDRPISPGSPWQNGIAERLISTVRRECLDRLLIFGEPHLRRILASYTAYYNQARTHLALQKDAPLRRAVQRSGAIVAIPILAGLHHQYVRI